MILKITQYGGDPNTLGFLLHKHPDRVQSVSLPAGKATICYPVKEADRITMVLVLELDGHALARKARSHRKGDFALAQYVNDRPFVASSLMSTAIAQGFGSALNGRCKDHPEWVDLPLDLEVELPVLPAPRGGVEMVQRWFNPLGYAVEAEAIPLDDDRPEWGESRYCRVRIRQQIPLRTLLRHLYVLIPAFDRNQHHYLAEDHLQKLLDKGGKWLANHPERTWIVGRYLAQAPNLRKKVQEVWMQEAQSEQAQTEPEPHDPRKSLHDIRLDWITNWVKGHAEESVADLGCGDGKLLMRLHPLAQIKRLVGLDLSTRDLHRARKRLRLEEHNRLNQRVELLHGSLTYLDERIQGVSCAILSEVIEHLELDRLPEVEFHLFEFVKPKHVLITTPNAEYNVRFEQLEAGTFRHPDHRFEWTRAEFQQWADSICEQYAYTVDIQPIGDLDPEVGAPSQIAIFTHETHNS
ncbi:3' terminal RNA ribose 2'-O-methyltransferase Hen1 [Pontibacter sp. G13]|uniref:3' terminal RNA ribose 2'-O-methyltransferase Hen1 n=1 Tax=Pontibacter sp. G13 TaxID=3074898 RepID=UPI002889D005|nr:3' terminal RNA ribose 2'-O-methyltransferase Hen1 [Pontibacter sp. G13]WNJ18733.1 3' terminal RNA ribose 2'-O-methyltransferase Hen1 [Pontibacter sp. G13]